MYSSIYIFLISRPHTRNIENRETGKQNGSDSCSQPCLPFTFVAQNIWDGALTLIAVAVVLISTNKNSRVECLTLESS